MSGKINVPKSLRTVVCVPLFLSFLAEGNRITPSNVAFSAGQCLVGDAAKVQGAMNPRNTVFGIQCLIGRRAKYLFSFSSWQRHRSSPCLRSDPDIRKVGKTHYTQPTCVLIYCLLGYGTLALRGC